MRAELLTIGSELLSGATVNTNAAYLAKALSRIGIRLSRQVAVADAAEPLEEALRDALRRSELVITTGGLGPTFDDVTVETIAAATNRPLVTNAEAAAHVRRSYKARHRRLQHAALRQARLPSGAQPVTNALGSAPGVWLKLPNTLLIALPGVPGEMRQMLDRVVLPRLRRLPGRAAIASATIRTIGIVELRIEQRLKRLTRSPDLQIGLYPNLRLVDVQLTATAPTARQAEQTVRQADQTVRRALGAFVYGGEEDTLEGVIGALCLARKATIALAESCTGGLIAARLTNVPGSSRYFTGGIIAYHNRVKRDLLGVPEALLRKHGAVSFQVAKAMAQGCVCRSAHGSIGLSVTGIAGPSGGSAKKPVGLVYIGIADRRGSRAIEYRFHGDRATIRAHTVHAALDLLRRHLSGLPAPR